MDYSTNIFLNKGARKIVKKIVPKKPIAIYLDGEKVGETRRKTALERLKAQHKTFEDAIKIEYKSKK